MSSDHQRKDYPHYQTADRQLTSAKEIAHSVDHSTVLKSIASFLKNSHNIALFLAWLNPIKRHFLNVTDVAEGSFSFFWWMESNVSVRMVPNQVWFRTKPANFLMTSNSILRITYGQTDAAHRNCNHPDRSITQKIRLFAHGMVF